MANKAFVLVAAVIAVAGCSSTQAPAPVERKPGSYTAISVPVASDHWMSGKLHLASNNQRGCGDFAANILPASFTEDVSTDITGGQDVFFHISRADEKTKCDEFGLFYATKGNVYTLNLQIKDQQCVVTLLEKTPTGTQSRIKTYPAYVKADNDRKVCISKDFLH